MEWTLYVDLDAYYVACELRDRPDLEGQRVLVGPDPTKGPTRGVVLSASYAARAFGARSAMPVQRAAELVPEAIWIPPDFPKYERTSQEVRAVLERFSDRVVPLSIDEAAVIVERSSVEEVRALAVEVQTAIRTELRLSASIGASPHRVVAKIASDREKPGGIVVVAPDAIARFLARLPVRTVPGVGPKTEARLLELGVKTLGDVAARRVAELRPTLGRFADELIALARGHPGPIPPDAGGPKSRSVDRTFAADVGELAMLEEAIPRMARSLSETLHDEQLVGASVGVGLRWADFTRVHRSRTVPHGIREAAEIQGEAERLLRIAWGEERAGEGRSVRTLSVRVERLRPVSGRQHRLDPEIGAPLI
ncbi:MAG: DNA polymerase IV [Thermoplasmata archaeon]|nr:DNA polymerase IV [Thermoplasmata archaeon]